MIKIHPKTLRIFEHILIGLFLVIWAILFTSQLQKPINYLLILITIITVYIFIYYLLKTQFSFDKQIKKFGKYDIISFSTNEIDFKVICNYKIQTRENEVVFINYNDLKTTVLKIDFKNKKVKYKPYYLLNIICEIELNEIKIFDILVIKSNTVLVIKSNDDDYYSVLNLYYDSIFVSDYEYNINRSNSIKLLNYLNYKLKT